MTSANQAGPKSGHIRPCSFKGHHFLLGLRRHASVSCAQNNCCSSEEVSWWQTINGLVVSWLQHRKLRPSNLAEDQQSRADLKWKSLNSDLSSGSYPQRRLEHFYSFKILGSSFYFTSFSKPFSNQPMVIITMPQNQVSVWRKFVTGTWCLISVLKKAFSCSSTLFMCSHATGSSGHRAEKEQPTTVFDLACDSAALIWKCLKLFWWI